jgi:hypothetical protein
MLKTTLLKSIDQNIKVLPGQLDFSQAVVTLNQKYLLQNLPADKLSSGFIKIPYTLDQINKIVEMNEIIVARCSNQIIGYYLIGGSSNCDGLTYQKLAALHWAESEAISISKIAYGVQVCINEAYHNNGLFANMFQQLVKNVASKYEYLFCSVSDENSRSLKIHLKTGWQVFDHSAANNILIYKITTLGV